MLVSDQTIQEKELGDFRGGGVRKAAKDVRKELLNNPERELKKAACIGTAAATTNIQQNKPAIVFVRGFTRH